MTASTTHLSGATGQTAHRSAAGTTASVPTVHREPVVTVDGRVVGYVITASLEPAVPAQPDGSAGSGAPRPAVPRFGHRDDPLHQRLMALDLPNLVADRYAFVPATEAMLDGHVPVPVVPGRLVLDLPEDYPERMDAGPRAAALRRLGMELALTDYRGLPHQDAMLPHVGFVVVDLRHTPAAALSGLVHRAHAHGARVLVTGVADGVAMEACAAAGADGLRACYGDRRPVTVDSAPRVLRAGELQCLALVHLLAEPEVDWSEVSQVIDTDPVLTLRVLHLVNSGAFGLAEQVDTVHLAVVLLGPRELTTLVAALLVDARPDAMDSLWFILARALTCEALAGDGAAYTVGMLSALAAQLGVPEDVIVDKVGVSPAVADAIRAQEGQLGVVLRAVRAHERNDAGAVLEAGMLPAEVSSAYMRCLVDALATARTVTRSPGF